MGIYVMKKGTITCDTCKQDIATVLMSVDLLANFEKHPHTVTCVTCLPTEV